jgi:hypothetical protein
LQKNPIREFLPVQRNQIQHFDYEWEDRMIAAGNSCNVEVVLGEGKIMKRAIQAIVFTAHAKHVERLARFMYDPRPGRTRQHPRCH